MGNHGHDPVDWRDGVISGNRGLGGGIYPPAPPYVASTQTELEPVEPPFAAVTFYPDSFDHLDPMHIRRQPETYLTYMGRKIGAATNKEIAVATAHWLNRNLSVMEVKE